jgi:hypothetical protein
MTGVIMTLWAIINRGTKVSHAMTMVHHIRVPLWQLEFNFIFFIVSFAFLLYSFSMYVPKIVLVEIFISSCHLSLSLCILSPTHVFFVSLPCSLYLFLFLSSYVLFFSCIFLLLGFTCFLLPLFSPCNFVFVHGCCSRWHVALQNVPNQHCELSIFLARCNWRFNVCKKKK